MAFNYKLNTYPECYAAKTLASNGGAHIINLLMEADTPNGVVVVAGDYVERDLYKVGAAPTGGFASKFVVREKDPSGLWLIEVATAGVGEMMLATTPINDTGYENREFTQDNLFVNGAGEVGRARELAKFDTYLVSADAIKGSVVKGANLDVDADGKLKVKAA